MTQFFKDQTKGLICCHNFRITGMQGRFQSSSYSSPYDTLSTLYLLTSDQLYIGIVLHFPPSDLKIYVFWQIFPFHSLSCYSCSCYAPHLIKFIIVNLSGNFAYFCIQLYTFKVTATKKNAGEENIGKTELWREKNRLQQKFWQMAGGRWQVRCDRWQSVGGRWHVSQLTSVH